MEIMGKWGASTLFHFIAWLEDGRGQEKKSSSSSWQSPRQNVWEIFERIEKSWRGMRKKETGLQNNSRLQTKLNISYILERKRGKSLA